MASGGQEVRGWWSGKASVEVLELWEGACQQRNSRCKGPVHREACPVWGQNVPSLCPLQKPVDGARGGQRQLTFLRSRWGAEEPAGHTHPGVRDAPLLWCVGLGGIQRAMLRRGQPLVWLGFPSHWRFWWVRICVCVCSFLSVCVHVPARLLGSHLASSPAPCVGFWLGQWLGLLVSAFCLVVYSPS